MKHSPPPWPETPRDTTASGRAIHVGQGAKGKHNKKMWEEEEGMKYGNKLEMKNRGRKN
jgi:hypothetical protein